jgi:hypothetical protein
MTEGTQEAFAGFGGKVRLPAARANEARASLRSFFRIEFSC